MLEIYSFNQEFCPTHTKKELPELLADEKAVTWVSLEKPTADELIILDEIFHFHSLTIEDTLSQRQLPKVEDFDHHLFIIFHGVEGNPSDADFETYPVAFYLGQNYLVSVTADQSDIIKQLRADVCRTPILLKRGSAFLLHHIIDNLVDLYFPIMEEIDDRIAELEEEVLEQTDKQQLHEIFAIKRAVLHIRRTAARQREVVYAMSRREFDLIGEHESLFFRDVHDHLLRVIDLAESYRDLVLGTMDIYLSTISNRLNETMKALTIISIIILPMTLISSIYGMNFEKMPELKWLYGYPMALVLMFSVGILLLVFFKKKGWL